MNAPARSQADLLRIGLIVAIENGRALANDAQFGFRDALSRKLGREPSETEFAEALLVQATNIATAVADVARSRGLSADRSWDIHAECLEAFNAGMAGGVQ